MSEITPIFKVSGYCSRRGEDTQRLKWAIRQFEDFDEYLIAHHDELVEWWKNPGGQRRKIMNDFIKEIGMAILWMFLGYLLGERSAREDKTDDQ